MIRLMQESDIDEILPTLREQETKTITRLGIDPRALLQSALGPYAFAGLANDRVACLWGITFPGNIGSFPELWLLTSRELGNHRIEFLRAAAKWVKEARSTFGPIEAICNCESVQSQRLLRWLGFAPIHTVQGYTRMRI